MYTACHMYDIIRDAILPSTISSIFAMRIWQSIPMDLSYTQLKEKEEKCDLGWRDVLNIAILINHSFQSDFERIICKGYLEHCTSMLFIEFRFLEWYQIVHKLKAAKAFVADLNKRHILFLGWRIISRPFDVVHNSFAS